jgi:hypothetical protein
MKLMNTVLDQVRRSEQNRLEAEGPQASRTPRIRRPIAAPGGRAAGLHRVAGEAEAAS